MTKDSYSEIPQTIEILSSHESKSSTTSDAEEFKTGLENREIVIEPERLERIIGKLQRVVIRDGYQQDPNERIKTIVRATKDVIKNYYYFNERSADEIIGLVNFIFKNDDNVFANGLEREGYDDELTNCITAANIAKILGPRLQEGIDIKALDLEDRLYLFSKSLKELFNDDEWKEESEINLSPEEIIQVQDSIDQGAEHALANLLANPNPIRDYLEYFQLPDVQELIAPFLNRIITDVRENPGHIAFAALATGTSVAWGIQEGFPREFSAEDQRMNLFANMFVNTAIFSGFAASGAVFANEVRGILSGNNPLGRRMVQLGGIALAVYLANQNDGESVGAGEAISIIGAAMAGISAAAALDEFASLSRPLLDSGIRQFSQLASNLFLPSNNVQAAQAQELNQQQNDIEGNNMRGREI